MLSVRPLEMAPEADSMKYERMFGVKALPEMYLASNPAGQCPNVNKITN